MTHALIPDETRALSRPFTVKRREWPAQAEWSNAACNSVLA